MLVSSFPLLLCNEENDWDINSQSFRNIIKRVIRERAEVNKISNGFGLMSYLLSDLTILQFLETTGTAGPAMSATLFDCLCSRACHGEPLTRCVKKLSWL